jgi:hypothetical protein
MLVHFCNPSTEESEAGGSGFEAILAFIMRPCLKTWRIKVIEVGRAMDMTVDDTIVHCTIPPEHS